MKLLDDIESLLSSIVSSDPLVYKNVKTVKKLLQGVAEHYKTREYTNREIIVKDGRIVDSAITADNKFAYAAVPLGLIIYGEVTVLYGGRGVKRLEPGDFIGLFETSDWIVNGRTRQIGDWTLVADNSVKILFFESSTFNSSTEAGKDLCDYVCTLSRNDRVPKPVSTLQLLDWVASHTTDSRLSDCAIIAHTHILPTNVALFRHLAHLVELGNIFVLGKAYSTVHHSQCELIKSGVEVIPTMLDRDVPYEFSVKRGVDLLWQRVIESQKKRGFQKLLIIDDGGDLWLSIPWADLKGVQIAGVEQTQRGINRIAESSCQLPPIVSVASSGIKKVIEASFIGAAVVEKLQTSGLLDQVKTVGVLGTGSIGSAVIESLKKEGKEALFYDNIIHNIPSNSSNSRNSVDSLMREADLIIGTTGVDACSGVVFDRVKGTKFLASASSSNIEFHSFIKLRDQLKGPPFEAVSVSVHEELNVEILNGGFPINFDREKEWEAAEDIVLTRCLLYVGIMQAAQILTEECQISGIYALDQKAQEKILTYWLADKKAAGVQIHPEYKNVKKVVNSNFLENVKLMPTVWK